MGDQPQSIESYEQLERRLTAWAQAEKRVLGGLVVGSRARTVPPPDRWADLDLVFFVTDPLPFASDRDWYTGLGPVWASHLEDRGTGDPEWFVLYRGGWKLDAVFTKAPEAGRGLADWMHASPHRVVFRRGFRVLLDRSQGAQRHVDFRTPDSAPDRPGQEALLAVIDQSWITAARGSRLIARGDLWRARNACDCDLKHQLLRLIEWQARWAGEPGREVWYDGRSLHEWADPEVLAALPETFAGYDRAGLKRSLLATLRLISQVGRQLAANWGYAYPAETERELLTWLEAHIPPMSPSKEA